MAIVPYRYTLKRTAKLWGSLGFCSVSSDNFFLVTYTCLSFVLTIDFCYSQLILFCILFKKDTQINKWKKRINILKKMISLKKGEGVLLLNFVGGPGVPLLNFEGGPGIPLLNFTGGAGSHFQTLRAVPCPGFQGLEIPGSWSHFALEFYSNIVEMNWL